MDASMWGTVVGGILGFLGSLLPKVFELIDGWVKHEQDHRMQAQQIDAAEKGIVVAPMPPPAAASTSAVISVAEGIVPAPGIPPECPEAEPVSEDAPVPDEVEGVSFGTKVFDAIRSSVRPVITYGFFALFLIIKLKGFYCGLTDSRISLLQLLLVIWDDGTESLFAAVLAFWFGSRIFEKTKALSGK